MLTVAVLVLLMSLALLALMREVSHWPDVVPGVADAEAPTAAAVEAVG